MITHEVSATTKFRKQPALRHSHQQPEVRTQEDYEKHCARNSGHILRVDGSQIVCIDCGARWKDEGF